MSSPGFLRNERLSKFLRFVVEQQLLARRRNSKSRWWGSRYLAGRRVSIPGRTQWSVRKPQNCVHALAKYYAGEGAGDPVVIELPKGGYTPVFRQPEAAGDRNRSGSKPPLRGSECGSGSPIVLAALALVPAAGGWWWVRHKSAPIPIAVLPLSNLSQDPANDYFADGLTDEIIRNLSIIDGLGGALPDLLFRFQGQAAERPRGGKQLEADYILEGSVLRAGAAVADQRPVGSGTRRLSRRGRASIDRELTDVFAIQDEISRGIVNSLRLKLGRGPPAL